MTFADLLSYVSSPLSCIEISPPLAPTLSSPGVDACAKDYGDNGQIRLLRIMALSYEHSMLVLSTGDK